jgi:peroxiredoxin
MVNPEIETETAPPISPRRPISRLIILLGGGFVLGMVIGALFFIVPRNQPVPFDQGGFWTLQPNSGEGLIGGGPIIGQQAPDFTLKTLDGGQVTLSSFRGQPVLINFWASWCLPCRLETPELVRAYQTHQAEGLVILGVNQTVADSMPDIKAFVAEFKMPYPVLLDEAGTVTDLYRLRGLPTSVFINRKGVITQVHLGGMTHEMIEQYLGEILK